MGGTYIYEHPAGAGFGEHHAAPGDPPLGERSAARHAAAGAAAHPPAPGEVSMADLDLRSGTVVVLAGTAGGGRVVEWADSQGTPRRTAVSPEDFAEFFREVSK